MSKKINLLKIVFIILTIALIGGSWYFYFNSKVAEPIVEIATEEATNEENNSVSYITDTSYDGKQELSKEVFAYPFSTSNSYIKNKDLVAQDSKKKLQLFRNKATNYMLDTCNIDYRSLSTSDYIDTVTKYYDNPDEAWECEGRTLSVSDMINTVCEDGVANNLETEATFTTDSSLIWVDSTYHVRGDLALTVYKCDDISRLILYPLELTDTSSIEIGITYHYICDITLTTSTNSFEDEDYTISSVDIVGTY